MTGTVIDYYKQDSSTINNNYVITRGLSRWCMYLVVCDPVLVMII